MLSKNTVIKSGRVIKRITKDDDVDSAIINFFKENPNPDDSKVHGLAEQLKMNPHDLESKIYALLSSKLTNDVISFKKSDVPDDKFDPAQLKMGIEVEKEHTDDPTIAKAIAKAHLSELPDYYTRLQKIENK